MTTTSIAFTVVFKAPLNGKALAALYPPRTAFILWTGDETPLFVPALVDARPLVTFIEDA